MSAESARKKAIQITVGEELSTAMLQGTKIEVSPDSNVIVYTNEGVQTKPAAGEAAPKGTHISADFNTIVLNGATIELAADGRLVISTPGFVITKPAPANDGLSDPPVAGGDVSRLLGAKANAAPEPGDEMSDGTIFAGISPDTHRPMYATPQDAPGTYTFNEAAKYAKNLDAHGHRDFRAPSKGELNVLWENRDQGKLKGTFNVTGSDLAGWYWSSSPSNYDAWAQRFSDGGQGSGDRHEGSSLRCVR